MTLIIALNVLLVVLVLGTIVGLHAWAISSSRTLERPVTSVAARRMARSGRRRRHTAARRLGNALALR